MRKYALTFLLCFGLIPLAVAEPVLVGFGPSAVGGKEYQGEQITVDLPLERMITNIGSKVDGAGMCVMTSIEQAGTYQGIRGIQGLRDWCAKYPGGGYPEKVEQQIKQYYAEKKLPEPGFLQYTGPDPEAVLDLIEKTGRAACVAYGYSPRYGGPINHMIYLAKAGGKYGCVVDNNLIGGIKNDETSRYEWMTREELIARMKTQSDRFRRPVKSDAWVFVWLEAPPPAVPFN
jgi:hypothetical protein